MITSRRLAPRAPAGEERNPVNYSPQREHRVLGQLIDVVEASPAPAFPPQGSLEALPAHIQDGMQVSITLRLIKSGSNACWLVAAPTTLPEPKIQRRAWLRWDKAQYAGVDLSAGFGHSTFLMRARTFRWLCTRLNPQGVANGR